MLLLCYIYLYPLYFLFIYLFIYSFILFFFFRGLHSGQEMRAARKEMPHAFANVSPLPLSL